MQQTGKKTYQEHIHGEGYSLTIVSNIKVGPWWQTVYAKAEYFWENETLWNTFEIDNYTVHQWNISRVLRVPFLLTGRQLGYT